MRQDSRDYVAVSITSRGGVTLDDQPVDIGLQKVPGSYAPLWSAAEWVGAAGTTREARILVGPDNEAEDTGTIGPLPAGGYAVLFRVTDTPTEPVEQATYLQIEYTGEDPTVLLPESELSQRVTDLEARVTALEALL